MVFAPLVQLGRVVVFRVQGFAAGTCGVGSVCDVVTGSLFVLALLEGFGLGGGDQAFGLLGGFLVNLVDLLLLLLRNERLVFADRLHLGFGGFHDGSALLHSGGGNADLLPAGDVPPCCRAGGGGLGLLAGDGCSCQGYDEQNKRETRPGMAFHSRPSGYPPRIELLVQRSNHNLHLAQYGGNGPSGLWVLGVTLRSGKPSDLMAIT